MHTSNAHKPADYLKILAPRNEGFMVPSFQKMGASRSASSLAKVLGTRYGPPGLRLHPSSVNFFSS
jgi:hypothetical protein